MNTTMSENIQLSLASDFVEFTGKHIFLTGKAGTGKTTFLQELKKKSPKRMIVVAPTGVAAINAGGVTIHSFFQLPFGPIIPGFSGNEVQKYRRFSREKRNIMKSLDLLVIDEISMVRADLLDGIDETLRRFRNNNQPFGGVQLLMIGDMQQLAPVVRDDDWQLLRNHYQSAFFFHSKALEKTSYISLELQHVYRQSDQEFIKLLNKIRDNKIDEEVLDILNHRYKPDFDPGEEDYIILTTHNARAKDVNESKLALLETKLYRYKAEVFGNFPEHIFPTETSLEFKDGAQVMFVKNDPDPEKRFYNGKIGKIIELSDDRILVQCEGDSEPIDVVPIEWQNMKYSVNEESKEIEEKIEGTFTQVPLKLAWAITIHKSQGLTFERAIIDSSKAFAYGQVYVALSRCRSLEGVVLSSPFSRGTLKNDNTIENFNREVAANQPDKALLEKSRKAYQKDLLVELFDFSGIQKALIRFQRSLDENQNRIQPGVGEEWKDKLPKVNTDLVEVSGKFNRQISQLLAVEDNVEINDSLQDRIKKGVAYFTEKLKIHFAALSGFSIDTDNKEVQKDIDKAETALQEQLDFKLACLKACQDGFQLKDFLDERARATIENEGSKKPKKKKKAAVSADINNPDLYNKLKEWRNSKSAELKTPLFMVLQLKTMRALSNQVPADIEDLKMIHGFGKRKIEQFGEELLEFLNEYRQDHEVVIKVEDQMEKPTAQPKKNTKEISLELWKEYGEIARIAIEREMVITTIEGHLAHYVQTAELPVSDFVSPDKLKRLTAFFERNGMMSLSEAKAKLGQQISYRDLKFVMAHMKRETHTESIPVKP